jgi:PAS domain S-box-containing protein
VPSIESRAAAFQQGPVPSIVYSADGRPRGANQAYRKLAGIAADGPLGLGLWGQLHEEDRATARAAWERAGQRLPLIEPTELRVLDVEGNWRWMLTITSPMPDSGEVVVTLIDVTARKELEAQVAAATHYTEALLHHSADIITVLEADGSWRSTNPRGTTIMGHPRGYDPEGGIFELIHPDDRDSAATAFAAVLDGSGDPGAHLELRLADANGDYRLFDVVGVNMLDDPTVAGVIVSARDVTERIEAREALARSNERYRDLVTSMQEGLWVIDAEAVTTYVNPRMAEMLGTSTESMVGTHLFDWIAPETRTAAASYMAHRQAGVAEVHEFTFRRSDGSSLPAVVSVAPKMSDGALVESIAVVTDVSQLHAVRDELDDALRHAQEANRAKTVFLSHVSHELRTPLNSILGYAWLLRDSADPGAASFAEPIEHAGRHLAHLIEELLDLTRLESGQMDLSLEPVALSATIADAARLAGLGPGRLRAEVTSVAVRADQARLVQVLVNLLSNADRHGPAGGAITVRTEQHATRHHILVSDEGPGITAEDAERIFEPFVQLDPGQPGARPGTGLGLSISRSLTEAMGGTLGVRPGTPTCFEATLEAAESLTPTWAGPTPPSGVVVMIEDDELSRTLLHHFFDTIEDITLSSAASLADGMDLIADLDPDAVLLDAHLPDGSGIDALRELRAEAATADLPVVVVTADTSPTLRKQALRAGADAFLVKPYALPDVHRAVADLLSDTAPT